RVIRIRAGRRPWRDLLAGPGSRPRSRRGDPARVRRGRYRRADRWRAPRGGLAEAARPRSHRRRRATPRLMTAVTGQASVEYAGLLGLAAALGAALALVAGPPLLGAVRNAFIAALSVRAHSPAPILAGAADIADVQSALLPTADGLTPDAALLALGQRHSDEDAHELADSLLLAAARATAPWLG